MNQTNDLRGRLGYIQDLAFMAVQAFINGDDAELANCLTNIKSAADETIKAARIKSS